MGYTDMVTSSALAPTVTARPANVRVLLTAAAWALGTGWIPLLSWIPQPTLQAAAFTAGVLAVGWVPLGLYWRNVRLYVTSDTVGVTSMLSGAASPTRTGPSARQVLLFVAKANETDEAGDRQLCCRRDVVKRIILRRGGMTLPKGIAFGDEVTRFRVDAYFLWSVGSLKPVADALRVPIVRDSKEIYRQATLEYWREELPVDAIDRIADWARRLVRARSSPGGRLRRPPR
jgi:hypothetical protein